MRVSRIRSKLWRLVMSKARFERLYAERSKRTIEELHRYGRGAYTCDCGEGGCQGWAMLSKEMARDPYVRGGRTGR